MTKLRLAAAAAGALLLSVAGGFPAGAATGTEHCDSIGLGVTAQFSAFVHHDASLWGTASGRVAIGGIAKLGAAAGWPGLSVDAGGAGGAWVNEATGGHVDVDATFASLNAKAAAWAGAEVNGQVQLDGDALVLSGTDEHQVIVDVDVAKLAAAKEIRIKVAAGAGLLVNVAGAKYDAAAAGLRAVVVWNGHAYVSAGAKSGIVWNFAAAKKITLAGGVWPGTVLAPTADVSFGAGIGVGVSGGIIVGSVTSVVPVNLGVAAGVRFCPPGGQGGSTPTSPGGGSSTPVSASTPPPSSVAVPPASSVTPQPRPQATPTEPLAYTGANVMWIAAVAAILLAAGGTALVLSRRRRIKN